MLLHGPCCVSLPCPPLSPPLDLLTIYYCRDWSAWVYLVQKAKPSLRLGLNMNCPSQRSLKDRLMKWDIDSKESSQGRRGHFIEPKQLEQEWAMPVFEKRKAGIKRKPFPFGVWKSQGLFFKSSDTFLAWEAKQLNKLCSSYWETSYKLCIIKRLLAETQFPKLPFPLESGKRHFKSSLSLSQKQLLYWRL